MQTDCYAASLSTSSDCDGTDSDNIFVKKTMVRSRVGLLYAQSILDDSSRRCGRVEILRKLLLFWYGVLSPAFSDLLRHIVSSPQPSPTHAGSCGRTRGERYQDVQKLLPGV
jgi:hypothetical protein